MISGGRTGDRPFPRPHRRGRIETRRGDRLARQVAFPRPHRRGRIETLIARRSALVVALSPGLTAGGGLKRRSTRLIELRDFAFPRPHRRGRIETHQVDVRIVGDVFPPASPPGAD